MPLVAFKGQNRAPFLDSPFSRQRKKHSHSRGIKVVAGIGAAFLSLGMPLTPPKYPRWKADLPFTPPNRTARD